MVPAYCSNLYLFLPILFTLVKLLNILRSSHMVSCFLQCFYPLLIGSGIWWYWEIDYGIWDLEEQRIIKESLPLQIYQHICFYIHIHFLIFSCSRLAVHVPTLGQSFPSHPFKDFTFLLSKFPLYWIIPISIESCCMILFYDGKNAKKQKLLCHHILCNLLLHFHIPLKKKSKIGKIKLSLPPSFTIFLKPLYSNFIDQNAL